MNEDTTLGIGMTVMAMARAAESRHPKRLFDDSFSNKLAPGVWQILLLLGVRQAILALAELRGPGAMGNLYCRTRAIDDALLAALAEGIEQVVILGAGFDTRAYRIPGIERTCAFELDLPAPQRLKKARLERALGALPPHVTLVPIDFDHQAIADVLAGTGYRTDARTFTIWEGVTQYITADAIDGTLHFVASNTAVGSKIAFTYIHRGIIDGSTRSANDQKLMDAAARGGMPWIFGLDPAELPGYLAERGLAFLEEMWAPVYQERYLEPLTRKLTVFAGERVALARVTTK